jgi:hypothetical protein
MSQPLLGISGGTVVDFHSSSLLGFKVAPVSDTDSVLYLLDKFNTKATLFRSLFIAGEDEYIYSVYFGLHGPRVRRVYTLSNTHLTMKDVSPSGAVYFRANQVVDKRRHVVYGTLIGDNDPRPDWLLGFELLETFS